MGATTVKNMGRIVHNPRAFIVFFSGQFNFHTSGVVFNGIGRPAVFYFSVRNKIFSGKILIGQYCSKVLFSECGRVRVLRMKAFSSHAKEE